MPEAWKHKWFGFWTGLSIRDAGQYSVEAWIDPEWCPIDKKKLIRYLEKSPFVVTKKIECTCPICGGGIRKGSALSSDGFWLWPYTLLHFVRYHNHVLPEEFIQHIRDRKYKRAKHKDVDWRGLDWTKDSDFENL